MELPLGFWDISLWLAITAIILLATAELVSPRYGPTNLLTDKRKLREAALAVGLLFLITVGIRIFSILVP